MPNYVDYPLSAAEITFFRALTESKVRFMLVGLASAVVQGAPLMTHDLDLWFEKLSDLRISNAAKEAGGVFVWRSDPPMLSGPGLDRIDIAFHFDGLGDFASEYRKAISLRILDFRIKILPIERILASKIAAGRPKDIAAVEALKATIAAIPKKKRT